MIAEMSKVIIAARCGDRDRLLGALRDLGVVHLQPADGVRAVADEQIVSALDRLGRAVQVLSAIEPAGSAGDVSDDEAATEVFDIQRNAAERHGRLATLHRQIEQLAVWGDVRLEQFAALGEAGIEPKFFSAAIDQIDGFAGELVQTLAPLPAKRVLVAVIDRSSGAGLKIPESAEPIELPQRDRPSIRAEAAAIDAALLRDAERLGQLANLLDQLRSRELELRQQAQWSIAATGGLEAEDLFALQGWVPTDHAATLAADLAAAGLDAAVHAAGPDPAEDPPSLIRYPAWAAPIKALFDILGTIPGYREFDLSGFFMIAMPIFVAMLIGDGGYGLLFVVLSLVFYRKLSAKAGSIAANLVLIFGITTVAWGVLTANYFGVTPETVAQWSGFVQASGGGGAAVGDTSAMRASGAGGWAAVGRAMFAAAPLYRADAEAGRNLIIKLSFIIGCIHLVIGQLRQALAKAPDIRALANVGWAVVLPGMLGVIWQLFFIGLDKPFSSWVFVLLGIGLTMVVLFSFPGRNVPRMVGLGIVANIMPLINTFSDTMSYIRLMAVGLASYYIAYAFNLLGGQVAEGSHWLAAVPVVLFGHALNIGLGLLAIFAHGVRLNMLEFSSSAGVQWSGYAYQPFRKITVKE